MTPNKTAICLLAATIFLPSCGKNSSANQLASQTRASEQASVQLYNRAVAAEKAGQHDRAAKDFRAVYAKYPLCPVAETSAYRHATILERQGKLLEAFDAYDIVIRKYPACPNYAQAIKSQETIAHQAAQGHITNSFIGIKSRIDVKRSVSMLAGVRDNAPRAASADKAQFTIGEVYQTRSSGEADSARAISAYRKLTRDYPDSQYAPEGQYRIGQILLDAAKKGNQDSANLDRARRAFDDVLIRYPNSKRASDAKTQIAKLTSGNLQRSYSVAEFYRKKGQTASALFYYRETVKNTQPGPLRSKAQQWINTLSTQ